jgi:hypothetical protein
VLKENEAIFGSREMVNAMDEQLGDSSLSEAQQSVLYLARQVAVDCRTHGAEVAAQLMAIRSIAYAASTVDTAEQLAAVMEKFPGLARKMSSTLVNTALNVNGNTQPEAMTQLIQQLASDWPRLGALGAAKRFAGEESEPVSPSTGGGRNVSNVAPVGTIAGNWNGTMVNTAGEEQEVTFSFSSRGNVLYGYSDRKGPREIELTAAGQQLQYIPPGGGVYTITFDEVVGSPHEAGYSARQTFERSGGVMDQQFSHITFQARMQGDQLAVSYEKSGQNYASGGGLMAGGSESTYRSEGMLGRVRR